MPKRSLGSGAAAADKGKTKQEISARQMAEPWVRYFVDNLHLKQATWERMNAEAARTA